MKILIVDDHPILHEVLGAVARKVFQDADVCFASDLEEALQHARDGNAVDLALLDLGLPRYTGMEALIAFRRAFPSVPTVVVSATEDRAAVLHALELGAKGYVPKTHAPPLMAAALRVVSTGGLYVPPQALEDGLGGEREPHLTGRQLDVLRLLVKGLANKEIAQRLRIANDTVKQHAKAIYAALGIKARSQAIRAAERRGIKLD